MATHWRYALGEPVQLAAMLVRGDAYTNEAHERPPMTTAVRILDDGAWISVDDERVVSVSELWQLADHDVCGCETADFLIEGFVDVDAAGQSVLVRAAGQCVTCGDSAVSGWLPVGRIVGPNRRFASLDTRDVRIPRA
ncbi:hypothetical protein [Halorhabdus sp. CUG00001]|nr:hypothetical protein [Halorhabdus sp. CUG00001]